mmetsp:Transcript_31899/g.28254  ORF Transcript_31899/g.28254 Transcript_31899/m.28254 type:complete len:96 (+) Transcript_31899:436-723(+)
MVKSKITYEELEDLLAYFFNYIINETMIPGKVENWVAIVDLQNVGVTQIPKDLLSAMGKALSSNFRGRMFRTFAINMPMLVRALWAVVKNVIDHF